MPNMEYGSKVRDAWSGYFATGQTIPANTNADGDEGALKVAKTMQRLRVVLAAKTTIALADTKALTMKLKSCATEGGSYADIPGASQTYTASGAKTWAAGEEIMSIPIPHDEDGGDFIKANVATTDAAATGTFDVFVEMLP